MKQLSFIPLFLSSTRKASWSLTTFARILKKKRKGDKLLPISLALKPVPPRPTAFTMRSVGESHGGRVIFENAERTRFDLSATCGRSVCPPPPPPPPLEATRPPPAKLQHLRHVLLSPRFSPKETTNAQKREKSTEDGSFDYYNHRVSFEFVDNFQNYTSKK